MNDSSTGGFIASSSSPPLEDDALDTALQTTVKSILGFTGDLVRPRWQPVNPTQPEPGVDWCAIGVTDQEPDDYPGEVHVPAGDGSDIQTRWERLTVIASVYGPNAGRYATMLRDGLYVPQNREALQALDIDLIEAKGPVSVPALVNQNWRKRKDITITLNCCRTQTYPVLNLLEAPDTLTTN